MRWWFSGGKKITNVVSLICRQASVRINIEKNGKFIKLPEIKVSVSDGSVIPKKSRFR